MKKNFDSSIFIYVAVFFGEYTGFSMFFKPTHLEYSVDQGKLWDEEHITVKNINSLKILVYKYAQIWTNKYFATVVFTYAYNTKKNETKLYRKNRCNMWHKTEVFNSCYLAKTTNWSGI